MTSPAEVHDPTVPHAFPEGAPDAPQPSDELPAQPFTPSDAATPAAARVPACCLCRGDCSAACDVAPRSARCPACDAILSGRPSAAVAVGSCASHSAPLPSIVDWKRRVVLKTALSRRNRGIIPRYLQCNQCHVKSTPLPIGAGCCRYNHNDWEARDRVGESADEVSGIPRSVERPTLEFIHSSSFDFLVRGTCRHPGLS